MISSPSTAPDSSFRLIMPASVVSTQLQLEPVMLTLFTVALTPAPTPDSAVFNIDCMTGLPPSRVATVPASPSPSPPADAAFST